MCHQSPGLQLSQHRRGEKLDYMMESRGPGLATIPARSWGLFILGADGPLALQVCLKSVVLIMAMQVWSVEQDLVLPSLAGLSLLAGTLRK